MGEFETVTFVFTDMVDSTATSSRLSPDAADQLHSAHFALLRDVIKGVGGDEVKSLGDGLMAAFASPSGALAAAVAMQQSVELANRHTDDAIGLRVGLSTGEVRRERDDYFGAPVVEAARLCARCDGGQILCSTLVKALGGRRATQSFSSLGDLPLKGLPEPLPTLEVHWEPLPDDAQAQPAAAESDTEMLKRCRESFRRKAWNDAYELLTAADEKTPLSPEDLERLATTAYLLGRNDACTGVWARAYRDLVEQGEAERAAQCAFWLAFGMILNGEMAPASGWLARAGRLVDDSRDDSVVQGYLLMPGAIETMFSGDAAGAYAAASKAAEIGTRFGDQNVLTLARLVQGPTLAVLGKVQEGLALLDEAMIAVTSDEVSPILAGFAYCAVISSCHECFDVRRAREWTAALSRWCAAQPDLITYRGQCLVHRSEIKQLHGEWPDARLEAERACDRLGNPPNAMLGRALYQRAELNRLSGEYTEAEQAYREAGEWGHEPQPGLALLRLAQGQAEVAATMLRPILDESSDPATRAPALVANVEILLATGDVEAARIAAEELAGIAAAVGAPLLSAMTDTASGAVILAEGDARSALATLRRAASMWRTIEAPYEAARTRLLVATACRLLDDNDTAAMELSAARLAFERLGATPDVTRVDLMSPPGIPANLAGLTGREQQVLVLVARGRTNREIGAELVISEHTVARHVQNIFTKLGLSSRTAATAYAYEQGLM